MNERQTKICFLAPNAFPLLSDDKSTQLIGGAELQQVIVATGLAARGYVVSMICLDFGQRDGVEIDGVIVHKAHRPSAGIPVLRFLWPRLTSIWRCLKKADADVYYYRTAGMLAGVLAAFCRRYGKKSIFAAAGNPDLERNTSKIRFARDRRIYEYGLRNVDRILVQNNAQALLCRRVYDRESIRVPNVYQAEMPGVVSKGCNVLWVSTIRRIKQPDLILEVAESLPGNHFQIVGGADANESSLYASIKARAERLENVEFIGYVPYSEIGQYFDGAAIFVNTSESEGFPNTFLQSWARGVPTVSFVDSGARLNDKPLGRIVQKTDDMAAAITALMDDELERAKVGNLCKAYVESVHSPDRVLNTYEEVIFDLTGPKFSS